MSFLVDGETRVLVQGITGRQGQASVELMREAGTNVVAGVTPGRGGTTVAGVPVFDTVAESIRATGATAAIAFVPGGLVRDAALEAIDQGLSPIVLMVDGVPIRTTLEVTLTARRAGVVLVGPNSPGVISPGKGLVGALKSQFYVPGMVAVLSRSGGMMTTIAHTLSANGLGQSTCVGLGGDALSGIDLPTAARLAEEDSQTEAIVVYGEIGSTQEERLAAAMVEGSVTKPVFVTLAGRAARPGVRYSHAGASIEGGTGGVDAKLRVLAEAGATVMDRYVDLPAAIRAGHN